MNAELSASAKRPTIDLSVQRTYTPILLCILLSSALPSWASNLNLIHLTAAELDSVLQPVLSVVSVQQSVPALLQNPVGKPAILTALKMPAAGLDINGSTQLGFPTLWGAVAISPNLTIGGHLGASRWKKDNIISLGPYASTHWQASQALHSFSIGLNQLLGPDDFQSSAIHLNYQQVWQRSQWTLSGAAGFDYTRCKIHVTDHPDPSQNYRRTKEYTLLQLQCSLERKIYEHLSAGAAINLSNKILLIACHIAFILK